jgi:hypothetical protein
MHPIGPDDCRVGRHIPSRYTSVSIIRSTSIWLYIRLIERQSTIGLRTSWLIPWLIHCQSRCMRSINLLLTINSGLISLGLRSRGFVRYLSKRSLFYYYWNLLYLALNLLRLIVYYWFIWHWLIISKRDIVMLLFNLLPERYLSWSNIIAFIINKRILLYIIANLELLHCWDIRDIAWSARTYGLILIFIALLTVLLLYCLSVLQTWRLIKLLFLREIQQTNTKWR